MPEETKTAPASAPKARTVRAGDAVNLVAIHPTPGKRFDKIIARATVTKVLTATEAAERWKKHAAKRAGDPQGKFSNGSHVDLEAVLPSGEPITITSSPRDDTAAAPDSWHFPAQE